MGYMDWSEKYSVGVASMDDQHKKLFRLLGDFYKSIEGKSIAEASAKILAGLSDYTKTHFADEERLMEQAGFAGLAEQKREHAAFVAKIADVDARLKSGKMVLSLEITQFVKDWLVNHIQVKDKQYSDALKAKGIR